MSLMPHRVKLQSTEGVLAGTTLRVVNSEKERKIAIESANKESDLSIELNDDGVCIKSDTVGGLEANKGITNTEFPFVLQV